MSEYLIVKFNDNYADEFDLSGCVIMPKSNYEDMMDRAKKWFDAHPPKPDPRYYEEYGWMHYESYLEGFGTNEELEWTTFKDFESCWNIVNTITEDEANRLKVLFGCRTGKDPSFVLGYIPRAEFEL